MRRERGELLIAPARAFRKEFRRFGRTPLLQNARDIDICVDLDTRGVGLQALVEAGVARTVIRDAAGRVQFDRGKWPHERPAQAETVLDRLVEILRRDIAFTDQAK